MLQHQFIYILMDTIKSESSCLIISEYVDDRRLYVHAAGAHVICLYWLFKQKSRSKNPS